MLSTVFKVCALAALVDARQKFSPRQTAFTQTAEFLAAADEKGKCTEAEHYKAACHEGTNDDAEKIKAIDAAAPKGNVIAKGAKKEDVKAACCPPPKSDGGSCGSCR
ncbi:unnamed protein product [Amoebophrya sp. A25]|nr:unnamed protein product [Amoebophrya sp. A25]|eukprot:GSA25T00006350001.1